MTTPIPDPFDYVGLSRHLIRQAGAELENGDYFQASAKGWGAVAHALKAIAGERGWNHGTHYLLKEVSQQVFTEFDRNDLIPMYDTADALHRNFYDNLMDGDEVAGRINVIKGLLEELETLRNSLPRPFTPEGRNQERRWARLTRRSNSGG